MSGRHKGMLKTFQRVSENNWQNLKTMLRTKKTLLFVALGAMLAQAAFLVTPKTASAAGLKTENVVPPDGSCYPAKSHICGLNGHNYNDKSYQGG